MNNLHQSADLSESVELNLNMPDIVLRALSTAKQLPVWSLEITCHNHPYKWQGEASSAGAATNKAMAELSDSYPDFNRYKARVFTCVQVAA